MRLVIAIILTCLLAILFFVGLFNQVVWMFLCSFFVWTPLAWWTGATWARANPTRRAVAWLAKREGIVDASATEQKSTNRRSRARAGDAYQ